MKLIEYAQTLGAPAGVDQQTAAKVLRALFADINDRLDKGETVQIPSLGRVVPRTTPKGDQRFMLVRPRARTEGGVGAASAAE